MLNNYYILLVHCISNIGGMQLYVSRKIEYLKSQGWIPLVYYYSDGPIEIPNLITYKDNHIKDLRICVGNVSVNTRSKVLERFNKDLCNHNKVIIESCCLALGTWGEYLAKSFKGKHILYVIDELVSSPTKQMADFIKFKVQQKLFYCIKPNVISKHLPEISNPDNLILTAVGCSNSNVVDYDNKIVDSLPDEGLNILSLGRLDKAYTQHLFETIAKFARLNSQKEFNLFVVGDTPNKSISHNLFKIVSNINNLKVFELGAIWPLPLSLFRKSKVAVGTAGSISLCSKQGVPSISIDFDDHEAIGILRVNTTNTLFRSDNDPKYSIMYWLNHILIDNQIPKMDIIEENPMDYSAHQSIIDMEFNNQYYLTESSKSLTSHQYTRLLLIKFDQTKIGHYIIQKLCTSEFVKKLIWHFNN